MKSNEALLTVRQSLISFFKRYEYMIVPAFKFILFFSALRMLRQQTGYAGALSNIVILLGITIVCTFASAECIIILAILVSTIFVLASNLILGILLFVGLCLIYILYGRLFPKESILIIVTLIGFSINMQLFIPIIAALFGSYACIGAILLGVILWYYIPALTQVLPTGPIDKSQILDTVNSLLGIDYKMMLVNKEMLITIVIFFIVFSSVYIIRKQPIDYGPYIAVAVGGVMNILGFLLGKIFFSDLSVNLILVVAITLVTSFVAVCMQFLSVVLDYQRAEVVNFEDDENYYFVKIVPKIYINSKQKVVKRVYSHKASNVTGKQTHMMTEREKINHMIMEDEEENFRQ